MIIRLIYRSTSHRNVKKLLNGRRYAVLVPNSHWMLKTSGAEIECASNADSDVREQALFWLAESDSEEAID